MGSTARLFERDVIAHTGNEKLVPQAQEPKAQTMALDLPRKTAMVNYSMVTGTYNKPIFLSSRRWTLASLSFNRRLDNESLTTSSLSLSLKKNSEREDYWISRDNNYWTSTLLDI